MFSTNEGDTVTAADVLRGLFNASNSIGKKYLEPKVYRAIRSEKHLSILRKLVGDSIIHSFRKKELMASLNPEEQKVFDNFLRKMRDLGVISREPGASGEEVIHHAFDRQLVRPSSSAAYRLHRVHP